MVIRTKLGPLPDSRSVDPTNAYSDNEDAAKLGLRFFFDPAFSAKGDVSCATCHDSKTGFQDARGNRTSEGAGGFTERHASTIINVAFGDAHSNSEGTLQFWDGRVDSLWSQALAPPENATEMGTTRGQVVLSIIQRYRADYEAVFGPLPADLFDSGGQPAFTAAALPGTPEWTALSPAVQDAITRAYVNFGKAIAAYEAQVTCGESRFDAFWREIAAGARDSGLLTDQEKLGLLLFVRQTGRFDRGYGRCIQCHSGPNFTDWKFHNLKIDQTNLGAPLPPTDEGLAGGVSKLAASEFHCASQWSDEPNKEICAYNTLGPATPEMVGQFKTPGLRCVSMTAPYMHTGSFETLSDVIDHYAKGGDMHGFVGSGNIDALALTAEERKALVAFLKALDGTIPEWTKQAP